ncbi:MAG: hypothetical protein M1817_001910 [Caeruleum heppii]|nr:MAG: hypothetical protein M1817_001910 [Caeruleum heppii]
MPRKAFLKDLHDSISESPATAISQIRLGEDDGTFSFSYTPSMGGYAEITIQALVPDLSEYPSAHRFFLYTISEQVPLVVSKSLESVSETTSGLSVAHLLLRLCSNLHSALAAAENPDHPSMGEAMDIDRSDNLIIESPKLAEGHDEGSVEVWSPPSPSQDSSHDEGDDLGVQGSMHPKQQHAAARGARICQDLRTVKAAGFKVGCLGSKVLSGDCALISVSTRISKLGISQEAMEAWGLISSDYLVLLIRYDSGYLPLDRIMTIDKRHYQQNIKMHVGTSTSYKPSYDVARGVFTRPPDSEIQKAMSTICRNDSQGRTQEAIGIDDIFIGRPLNAVLNERFIPLLAIRLQLGLGWRGAEDLYNDSQGKARADGDAVDAKYYQQEGHSGASPATVTADHLSEGVSSPQNLSLPLLAMQFLLRHLVRCTEFCSICHSRTESTFEALKPYVCSKPLCLWQYMALGFGPSIEYEIISQPAVVDLLVGFCYASAAANKLQSFPAGMDLLVPPKFHFGDQHKVRIDVDALELVFESSTCPTQIGQWMTVDAPTVFSGPVHCSVVNTSAYPRVRITPPVHALDIRDLRTKPQASKETNSTVSAEAEHTGSTLLTACPAPSAGGVPASVSFYNQNFDALDQARKCSIILLLLDTLPRVEEMKTFLDTDDRPRKLLGDWKEKVSPAALGILRWIVASNRSCIMQITVDDNQQPADLHRRVHGMSGWKQFRFAQGAPDKEQRFVNARQETVERLGLTFPSIFAWHGSPMYNWHGIVREGLHFKEIQHGRSYGEGCYHSLDYNTSKFYSSRTDSYKSYPPWWPRSMMNATAAMSLNEIVNAPQEFVSSDPHLVVAQLDWIQTRYLFVQCAERSEAKPPRGVSGPRVLPASVQVYPQDPKYTPRGENNTTIVIPAGAVSSSHRALIQTEGAKAVASPKRPRLTVPQHRNATAATEEQQAVIDPTDDATSIRTTDSDVEALLSDSDRPLHKEKGKGADGIQVDANPSSTTPATDFVPGTLDHSTLQLLDPPSYASPIATKALQRELKTIITLQTKTPPAELGWYMDPTAVNNVYQWILELHSFDAELPLAQQLKQKGLTSVVLEMRFGREYPYSPPFVRVIRPRFLGFAQQGGGHVTAGGALCMELLTNTGWSAVSSMESVLLQVHVAMSSTEPYPARLDMTPGGKGDYAVGEAMEAYVRACRSHGWEVPKDFGELGKSK